MSLGQAFERQGFYQAAFNTEGRVKAYQYALSGQSRSRATRADYYRPIGQVQIGGTLRSSLIDKSTVRIVDVLNAQPNTASFECFDFTPARGQEVIISLGTIANRLFAGHILTVEQTTPNLHQRVRFTVSCVDYTWLLDTRRITGMRYTNETVTNIINDLMTRFAPTGFTTTNVEASMDAVDFTANHAETLMQALTRLMKMASKGSRKGGYCYVDYTKGLHAFVTPETDSNPRVLQATNFNFWDLEYRVDLSQVRTRVYVLGGTTQTTSPTPNTSSAIPVDDTRKFSATGGRALTYGNQIVYTGTSPASGPGWLTGVTSFAYSLPQGESVRVLATRIGSNAASSMSVILGASHDGLVDHVIEDERLNDAGAIVRGDGELGLFEQPEGGVTLFSRDKFLRSGKTLPASLTVPTTISAEFTIQEVEISDLSLGASTKFPLRRVNAATTYRDGFELLAGADRRSTEGPG